MSTSDRRAIPPLRDAFLRSFLRRSRRTRISGSAVRAGTLKYSSSGSSNIEATWIMLWMLYEWLKASAFLLIGLVFIPFMSAFLSSVGVVIVGFLSLFQIHLSASR